MVRVSIERNSRGLITGFTGTGHALYASRGQDIVCAAVSVLLQTTLLGLLEVVGLDVQYSRDEGYLSCHFSPDRKGAEEAQILLQTMVLGLEQIAEDYGDYIALEEKEV